MNWVSAARHKGLKSEASQAKRRGRVLGEGA